MQVILCGKYLVTKAVIGQIMKMYFGGESRERVEGVRITPTLPSSLELLVYFISTTRLKPNDSPSTGRNTSTQLEVQQII